MTVRVEILHGAAIADRLDGLAALRIAVFRDFPYLYEGSTEYERGYLQTYVRSPRSICVMVWDGGQMVGASTGLPLADEVEEFRAPFVKAGHAPETVFYCGESVLLPAYRGKGLGRRFFTEREAHARSLTGMDWTSFCAVQRPADHPARPADYQPLDEFWMRRGYRRVGGLETSFSWKEVGGSEEISHPMGFWLKRL